jgi:hypothetical protein
VLHVSPNARSVLPEILTRAGPLHAVQPAADSVPDITVDAITRRGKSVECRLSFTPLRSGDRVSGAILVMDVDVAQ